MSRRREGGEEGRRRGGGAASSDNQWRPQSDGRDEVVCLQERERERLRGGGILSADGAGSQPDSV